MKIRLKQNVLEASLDRIRYLFSEFPNLVICFSGGKDSTVILNLSLQVAEELGRLPLPVMFIDQEAEWQATIDYTRLVMQDPRVLPLWYQMPIRIENATSGTSAFLYCWGEGEQWMRDKEPNSIHHNTTGTKDAIFNDLFPALLAERYPSAPACYLSGIRAAESPARFAGLTFLPTYKHITYGKVLSKPRKHYSFYPIYDWETADIWKAIHSHSWPYCSIYDEYYRYGVNINAMRVSNLHHETAMRSFAHLQEIEPATWNALTKRLSGTNTAGHLQGASYKAPTELPAAFASWREYRDYLLDNLISREDHRAIFLREFARMDKKYQAIHHKEKMYRAQITSVLCGDWCLVKAKNWERTPEVNSWRRYQKGIFHPNNATNKYIHG